MHRIVCPKCHSWHLHTTSSTPKAVMLQDTVFEIRQVFQHVSQYALAGAAVGRQVRLIPPVTGTATGFIIGSVIGSLTCPVSVRSICSTVRTTLFRSYQCSHCGHRFKRFSI